MEVRLAEAWEVGSEAYGDEQGEEVGTFVHIMHITCIDRVLHAVVYCAPIQR
jgi:hypothetical protein